MKRINLTEYIERHAIPENLIEHETDSTNDCCTVFEWFLSDLIGDRGMIDSAEDFKSEGWQHFETPQDAHYYGQWCNPKKLQFLSYTEGDVYFTVCPDQQRYDREMARLKEFHGQFESEGAA